MVAENPSITFLDSIDLIWSGLYSGLTTQPPVYVRTSFMSAFQPIVATRLYRMIADQITSKILAGDFLPGERLPSERDLAKMLQVSRASVREALIALEIEEYVDVRVGTGVFVTPAREADASNADGTGRAQRTHYNEVGAFELLEARLLIEPECAAMAAKNATDSQLAAIVAAAQVGLQSQHPGQQDRAFHVAIAEGCGNAALAAAVITLWDMRENSAIFSRMEQHFVTHKVWQVAEKEHDKVLRAIKDRDSAAARLALRSHLTGIIRRLRESFPGDSGI